MNKKLVNELEKLEQQEKYLIRTINDLYYDSKKRNIAFNNLKELQKKINMIKFKINYERESKKWK